MLKQPYRITSDRDFSQIYRRGKRLSAQHLGLFYLPRQGQEFSRFGFVVSKKSAVKIAARNRVKRVLRGYVQSLLPGIRAGFDVVVSARTGITDVKAGELRDELGGLLEKAKII